MEHRYSDLISTSLWQRWHKVWMTVHTNIHSSLTTEAQRVISLIVKYFCISTLSSSSYTPWPRKICKGKIHLYTVPQAEHATSVALLSQTETVFRLSGSPNPHSGTLASSHTQPYSAVFNGFHHCNPWITTHLLTPAMEGWVGLVCWAIVDSLPTKWSSINHRSGTGDGKSASQRPMSEPLSYSANKLQIL